MAPRKVAIFPPSSSLRSGSSPIALRATGRCGIGSGGDPANRTGARERAFRASGFVSVLPGCAVATTSN